MGGEKAMQDYVQLNEVLTWYEQVGDGEPLLMLHPGGADTRACAPCVEALRSSFCVYAPERRGHGRTPDVAGPITYELMAADMIAFIDTVVGAPVVLVGYSAGATVALIVALRRPDLIRQMVLISGVFHRDGWIVSAIDPHLPPHPALAAGYAELSPDGPDHFPVVHEKLALSGWQEPTLRSEALAAISNRVLVMVADDDEVTLEHAIAMYRSLPAGELAVVPGTSHGLLHEKPRLCNTIMLEFLTRQPIATLVPIRRAAGDS